MKYKGLDDKEYKISLSGYTEQKDGKSSLHKRARELLKNEFPSILILEEVYIASEKLYLDFLIPSLKICIEVNGEQHFKNNVFFYGSKLAYKRAILRDQYKKEWCELNNITIVDFNYNEKDDEWLNKIYQIN